MSRRREQIRAYRGESPRGMARKEGAQVGMAGEAEPARPVCIWPDEAMELARAIQQIHDETDTDVPGRRLRLGVAFCKAREILKDDFRRWIEQATVYDPGLVFMLMDIARYRTAKHATPRRVL